MMMHGFGIPEFFIIFVFLGLVALGVVALILVLVLRKKLGVPTTVPMIKTSDQDSALIILRERFAWGEISKTEFDEMRQALVQY